MKILVQQSKKVCKTSNLAVSFRDTVRKTTNVRWQHFQHLLNDIGNIIFSFFRLIKFEGTKFSHSFQNYKNVVNVLKVSGNIFLRKCEVRLSTYYPIIFWTKNLWCHCGGSYPAVWLWNKMRARHFSCQGWRGTKKAYKNISRQKISVVIVVIHPGRHS